jgi:hypothetical protein
VTNPTAQDAPGPTIVAADDLPVDAVGHIHTLGRPRRTAKRRWTLPAPWTRRRAHRALENGGPFPTAPTAIRPLRSGKETSGRSYSGPATGQRQLPSSLRSPASSFAGPSPAEIVVANRQK